MGELPLLRRATVLRPSRSRRATRRAPRRRAALAESPTCAAPRPCACRPRSSRSPRWCPRGWIRAWRSVDAGALAASQALIVNIDYPLGVAAYNILREVAVDSAALRGVYVLGKAATLNADVGDVMISNVVHDEHSQSHLLARQRVHRRRPGRRPALRDGPGQPARGHGQEHVSAEPLLPGLLLPRGVHGGRDGGGAVLQRRL